MLTDKQLELYEAQIKMLAQRRYFYWVAIELIFLGFAHTYIWQTGLMPDYWSATGISTVLSALIVLMYLLRLRRWLRSRQNFQQIHGELLMTDVQVQMSNALREASIKRTMFYCVCAVLAILLVILPALAVVLGVALLTLPAVIITIPALMMIEKRHAELNAKDRGIQNKYASIHPFFSL